MPEMDLAGGYILYNASHLDELEAVDHALCSLSSSLKILLFYFAFISSHRLHLWCLS